MRKKLTTHLRTKLLDGLKARFPSATPLDESDAYFNGSFGFSICTTDGLTFFLTVIVSDEQDLYRVSIAWSDSEAYPQKPFRDTIAAGDDYLRHTCAEVQLAQLLGEHVPFEFFADAAAFAADRARQTMLARVQRGFPMVPEEWLATFQFTRSSLEDCKRQLAEQCEVIVSAMADAIEKVVAAQSRRAQRV